MSLPEILYMIAFCLYLLGAGWALWRPDQRAAVALVAVALALDLGITVAPLFGVEALTFQVTGRNIGFNLGAPLGVLTWLLVGGGLVARWRGQMDVFRGMLLAALLTWFLCFQAFQIGLHVLPQV